MMERHTFRAIVRRGRASKRKWISIQEKAGLTPDLRLTSFYLHFDEDDFDQWDKELRKRQVEWTILPDDPRSP